MDGIPIPRQTLETLFVQTGFDSERLAIREVNRLTTLLEEETGIQFVRMEFGVPNIPPPEQAAEAERKALAEGAHGTYPPFDGIPRLKRAGTRFLKAFLDLDTPTECIVATCGSMQGGFIAQALAARMHTDKGTILFLDPTFPVSQLQARFLGLPSDGLELGDLRGEDLLAALEERLARGDIGGVFWSSPNNPSWICLTELELEGIARLCDEYDVLAIEDQAYLGMDFREDYSRPGEPPFIPSVSHYGRNWVMLISSSKAFSYPGQRCALAVISPALHEREFPALEASCGTAQFGHAFAHGGLYVTTSGASHTAQHGLAAMLEAACNGELNFVARTREYGERARRLRELFLATGFKLVYDDD
ncbi:MAG: pyridoxal phosphate-dependent aminotransferase, partial [Candidatus Thermoplasmatota archaeon]|nr:pyridoxal phosphate-dependent aminotransferase [Candidatus Thermoplasmatota archaeon]